MLQFKHQFQTFEDYLSYNDGTDNLYELFHGELIEMPPESGFNVQIANKIFLIFALLIGSDRVRGHGLELEVGGKPRNRYPDLTIIREEHIKLLEKRNTIRLFMPPPLLVIEIVSPGELERDRDYVAKRIQYQDCEIPEYWIIDPETQNLLVLELTNKTYSEVGNFANNDKIISPQFKELTLTLGQLFNLVR